MSDIPISKKARRFINTLKCPNDRLLVTNELQLSFIAGETKGVGKAENVIRKMFKEKGE
jgi:hypothetical protein